MRPQSNQRQQSGEQKKSVFDRLGQQLDTGRPINRGSPARYSEHPMHPGIHELPPPEFGCGGTYMKGEGPIDIDWRYATRQPMPFGRPDRHPSQPPSMPHYDMDVVRSGGGREPLPYYQHPHVPPFPPGPPGAIQPMLGGPDPIPMRMHPQRRLSPKYDRHGNPIRGGSMRMDHPPCMSPPSGFRGPLMPGLMLPPGGYDMMPMRPGMYPHERWNDSMGPMSPQMPDPRFLDQANNQRFHQQQQQQGPMMMNPDVMLGPQPIFEAPRYSKWRERRDVITNLDRQTAQSSSKTDSLKSSLQQPDNKGNMSKRARDQKANEQSLNKQSQGELKKSIETTDDKSVAKKSPKRKPAEKKDPQDISDGEIIDDEDSSDDSDSQKETPVESRFENDSLMTQNRASRPAYLRKPIERQYQETGKRRRLQDRDEYSMDYETISDEELDDFMSDKKLGEDKDGEGNRGKNQSEMELLNALGLDWATLIEMSKQSRKETPTSDSALRRFSISNYLPTLGISKELAGPEIYNLIIKITS